MTTTATGAGTGPPAVTAPSPSPPARRRVPTPVLVGLGVVMVATASLLLPAALTHDAWAWLVWGREVGRLDLDTTGGPSWKPLPVAVTTVLTAVGGGTAPALWLVAARAGGLLALVAVYRLASRAAGWVAGTTAVALLVLTPDTHSRFVRLLAEGHTAPLEVALWLWAIERAVAGRATTALWLGSALALLRPEAWPFLGAYAAWLWWRRPASRWPAGVAVGLVPLLWFGADWWGSGSPWHGADLAQVATVSGPTRLRIGLQRLTRLVIPPAYLLAAVAVVTAGRRRERPTPAFAGAVTPARRRERPTLAFAGAAVGWAAVVVAMIVLLQYAALSRFLLPSAALLCVLAGIGLARVLAAVPAGGARTAAAALTVAILAAFAVPRVGALDTVARDGRTRERFEQDVAVAVERAGGREAVLSCGRVAIQRSGLANAVPPALAWELDVPLAAVTSRLTALPGVMFTQSGGALDRQLADPAGVEAALLTRTEQWAVYAVGCDPPP